MQKLKSKRNKPEGENSEDKEDNSQSVIGEKEKEHIFQYGIIPMKHIQDVGEHQDILRQNKLPKSALSSSPIYLIREKETNSEIFDLVIKRY